MTDGAYQAAVKETFETKPLRTVLMIDDEFPTFADLAVGENDTNSKRFKQKPRAVALYEGFRARQMICDVENQAHDIHTERFRKSDLIILDYNLGPGEHDNERALAILRRLAESKHFNTVVVYTAQPNQDEVWLEVLASLAGGWTDLPANLTGDAQVHWDRLSDAGTLPEASLEATKEYAARGELRDLTKETRAASQKELTDLEVPPAACGDIISALIHRELAKRAGKYAGEPRQKAVGGYANGTRWVQSRNSFVAILKKGDLVEGSDDPAGIMACLGEALLAWRPNLFQVLISEIQNILELEALATEDHHLREPATQAALWYYLLDSLGPIDLASRPDVAGPLMSIVDKIVDGIRRRLSSDGGLLELASGALLGELRDTAWTDETWPKSGKKEMITASQKLSRTEGLVTGPDILFRLNSFFSTERFRRAHLTTGTIIRQPSTDTYWVTASPACDLVAREPSGQQVWARSMHPLTSFVGILLHPVEAIDKALADAANARHIFLETPGGQRAFKLVNDVGQPSYEFIFALNEGRVRQDGDRTLFAASRLEYSVDPEKPDTDASGQLTHKTRERRFIDEDFEVIDQLRGVNATRILQMAGQHLSRIGLDYISMPTGDSRR